MSEINHELPQQELLHELFSCHFSTAITHKESSEHNGEVPALLAHIFAGYQGSSGTEAAIVYLCCCISECIDSCKCFVSINDALFFCCCASVVL